jgi:hypothetical protein
MVASQTAAHGSGQDGLVLSPGLGRRVTHLHRSFRRVVGANLIGFAWGRGNSRRQRQGGHLASRGGENSAVAGQVGSGEHAAQVML